MLRAATACTFSTSQLPKVLRGSGVFNFLTSKSSSRHNGVQFFISHLPRWLRTRRFSEPTFRPSGATKHWKTHGVSRLFYLFAHLHLVSSDSFSSLISFLLTFSCLTLPISTFLSVCPYCRKFDFQTSFDYIYRFDQSQAVNGKLEAEHRISPQSPSFKEPGKILHRAPVAAEIVGITHFHMAGCDQRLLDCFPFQCLKEVGLDTGKPCNVA